MTHWAPPHTRLSSHSFTSVEKKEHPSRQPSSAVGPGPWPEVGVLAHTVLAVLGLLVARVTEASEGAQQVLTVAVSATQCLVEATLVDICLETQRWTFRGRPCAPSLRPDSCDWTPPSSGPSQSGSLQFLCLTSSTLIFSLPKSSSAFNLSELHLCLLASPHSR